MNEERSETLETMAAEERAQILQMLVAGRVTVDQAERLVEALETPSAPRSRAAVSRTRTPRRGDGHPDAVCARLAPEHLVAWRDRGAIVARSWRERRVRRADARGRAAQAARAARP